MFSQLEFLIAFRYLRSKRSEGFISIIAGFSLVGIILGVATLIIVMSVMNGFRAELIGRILGLNGLNHDATATLIHGSEIRFAGHTERYSEIKFEENISKELLSDVQRYGDKQFGDWDTVVWFEQPLLKKSRQLYAGQYSEVFTRKNLPSHYLKQFGFNKIDYYVPHHLSHASSTYFTSPYTESAVVCIDAIGEFDTITIWYARGNKLEKRYSQVYPHSLGLWYSAMTQRLDLKPQEDEFILMGMAAWGRGSEELRQEMRDYFFKEGDDMRLKRNLHRGCLDWDSDFMPDDGTSEWMFDIAHNVQVICEEEIQKIAISSYLL